jgi:exodeoxyribonuclease VII small subunit
MTPTTKFDFTEGYKELENIVAEFESREIDLEKDLEKFERGLKLATRLQKRLKEIENKVTEIDKRFTQRHETD